MAYPRSEEFDRRQLEMADWSKALAHPGRVALLEILCSRTTCTCGELVDQLPLAQATVSQHLKVLKDAGLIKGTIDGPRSCYCVDREALTRAREAFEEWFQSTAITTSCC